MKKLFIPLFLLLFITDTVLAQAPEKFTYQAVIRNTGNQLVTNSLVGIQISVLQNGISGSVVFIETHSAMTNENGLLTIAIGGGNLLQGDFSSIDWGDGPYFLKSEIDPNGGSNYSITSVQQLMSVPYALYSKEAGNSFSGDYNDLINSPTIPQIPTDVSYFNNDAGYITMDSVPALPTNVSTFTNDIGYLTSYSETDPQFNAWDKDYNDLINRPTIPYVPTNVSAFNNDAGYITMDSVPALPTNVSAFTNDLGYLTSYSETDPQFNAWDKDYNDLINRPSIPSVPTNVSSFTNDANYVSNDSCLTVSVCQLFNLLNTLYDTIESMQETITNMMNTIAMLQNTDSSQYNPTLPTVTTDSISNITDSTATCYGTVSLTNNAMIIACGFCWSTSQFPTINDNHISTDANSGCFTSVLTGLSSNTTYFVRAYATNNAGTAYGEQISFTSTSSSFNCGSSTVIDHEGNVYHTVQIGTQCWLKENLRCTTSPSTGSYLVNNTGNQGTYSGKQARWYNDDSTTYAPLNYGLLYNWNAAVDTFCVGCGELSIYNDATYQVNVTFSNNRRGICPQGWHVPCKTEWNTLKNFVGSQNNYVCGYNNTSAISKSLASSSYWDVSTELCAIGNYPSNNNATGFSALPTGQCHYGYNVFGGVGGLTYFWSTTQGQDNYTNLIFGGLYLTSWSAYPADHSPGKIQCNPVRCLKD